MKTLRILGIGPAHPRHPEASRIELRLMPTDRKADKIDVYTITEEQALELAERALTAVRIIRDTNARKASLTEADRRDMIEGNIPAPGFQTGGGSPGGYGSE